MPGSANRTLTISAGNLTDNVNLVFAWTGLGDREQAVIWRSLKYEANVNMDNSQTQEIKYNDNLRFIDPIVKGNRIVYEEAMMDIENGEETTLISDGSTGTREFTKPTPGREGAVTVTNRTLELTNIVLGFAPDQPGEINAALFWENVPSQMAVTTTWTPNLYAYAFVGGKPYEDNQLVREFGVDAIWNEDLSQLSEVSGWLLEEKHGKFTLKQLLE